MSRLRPLRYPALLFAAGLLLAVGVGMVWGLTELRQGVDRVEHSYRVLVALNTAQGHLRSAESAARGYRRTGAPALYAELRELVPDVREQAAQLARLTTDNPPQNQRVLQWQELIEYRLQELTALADGETGGASADAALAGDVRAGTTARTSEAATRILEVEEELLLERRAIIDERTGRLTGFVVLGIVLPLVVLTLLLQGLLRENRRSRRLEREARNAALEMEASLVERDRVTEQHRLLGSYTGLLQSCQTLPEAFELTTSLLQHLLPHAGGHCYALDASRNLAEVVATFGTPVAASAEVLSPDDCWALRRGQPHRTDDRHGHVTCRHIDRPTAGSGVWTLCVPLVAQGNSLGLLHASALGNDGRTDNDTALLETVGEQLSLAMVNLQLRESLRQQSLRDPLTGLFNRRYLENKPGARAGPLSPPWTAGIGVDAGRRPFQALQRHPRPCGGRRPAAEGRRGARLAGPPRRHRLPLWRRRVHLVLPETDAAMAMARAEQVRATVAATTITHMGQQLGPATVSIGVASAPVSGNTPGELLEAADAALYRAKAGGRDRVEAA